MKPEPFSEGDIVRERHSIRLMTVLRVYPAPITVWVACSNGREYEASRLRMVKRKGEDTTGVFRLLTKLNEMDEKERM